MIKNLQYFINLVKISEMIKEDKEIDNILYILDLKDKFANRN